jgi:hypothetical protein
MAGRFVYLRILIGTRCEPAAVKTTEWTFDFGTSTIAVSEKRSFYAICFGIYRQIHNGRVEEVLFIQTVVKLLTSDRASCTNSLYAAVIARSSKGKTPFKIISS